MSYASRLCFVMACALLLLFPVSAQAGQLFAGTNFGKVFTVATGDGADGAQGQFTPLGEGAHSSPVYALARKETVLLSGDKRGNVMIWDLATATASPLEDGHRSAVRAAAFSPDGSVFATASKDRTVIIWDATTLQKKATLEEHDSYVYALDFTTDGSRMLSTGADNHLILWDTATWEPLTDTQAHYNAIYMAKFSPDGGTIATCSADKQVKLWNTADLSEIRLLEGHEASVYSIAFSQDGQTLISAGSDRTIRFWNVATGEAIRSVPLEGSIAVNTLVLGPAGEFVYAGDDSGVILKVAVETGAVAGSAKVEGSVKSLSMALSDVNLASKTE